VERLGGARAGSGVESRLAAGSSGHGRLVIELVHSISLHKFPFDDFDNMR
jgi:hypothetical protein